MPQYDSSRFDPSAPLAQVTLRHMLTGATVADVSLLLDSGSDITLLPRLAVEQISVTPEPDQWRELMGFDGSRSVAAVAVLDMIFLRRAFRGRYLLIDQECGIMGRDILNHVALLLDGPRRQWSESAT